MQAPESLMRQALEPNRRSSRCNRLVLIVFLLTVLEEALLLSRRRTRTILQDSAHPEATREIITLAESRSRAKDIAYSTDLLDQLSGCDFESPGNSQA